MRFLFRLILIVILLGLILRVLRMFSSSKPRVEQKEPPRPLRADLNADRIEDASFTDISERKVQ